MLALSTTSTVAMGRAMSQAQGLTDTAMARLSTGRRINSAKDDAAGLAIATRLTSQMRGMQVGARNASDAISMAQVGDAALGSVSAMMSRMRELAVQAVNETSASGAANLNKEFQDLAAEITRVLDNTDFNGKKILAGDAGSLSFQIGAGAGDTASVTTTDMSAAAGITALSSATIATTAGASSAISALDTALDAVTSERSTYGAMSSRFESVVDGLLSQMEATDAARSRIEDADMASEMANLAKGQILQQASVAMLSQANLRSQMVLQLLRGG